MTKDKMIAKNQSFRLADYGDGKKYVKISI